MIPVVEAGRFIATNTSSGGAFTGDYPDAGITLIGFSFMAENVLPSDVQLRWHGPTASYFRSFTIDVVSTGVWYRFAFSLRSKEAGDWAGGSSAEFDDNLLDVQWLEIYLTRSGIAAQRYYIDDVFVAGLPAGWLQNTTGDIQVVWSSLRTNITYTVETADQPTGAWDVADSFMATNTMQIWPDPAATNRQRVYRLLFDENP